MLQAFCDGSITGSSWAKKGQKHTLPHAWSGWWARDEGGRVLHHQSLDLGEAKYMSANIGEYVAVRSALKWLRDHHPRAQVEVLSDSQLVIRQLIGNYNCYVPHLILLRDSCRELAASFPYVTYTWIRREQNQEADVLSKGLQIWDRQPTWQEVIDYLGQKR